MTTEQRERIAREILGWEPELQHEGKPYGYTFWHVAGCDQQHGHRYSGCPADIPAETRTDWLFPLETALMLLGWDFWWDASLEYWMMKHHKLLPDCDGEVSLADAVNAAAVVQIGEGE